MNLFESFHDELEKISASIGKVDRLRAVVKKFDEGPMRNSPAAIKARTDLRRLKKSLEKKEQRRTTDPERLSDLFRGIGDLPREQLKRMKEQRSRFSTSYPQPSFERTIFGPRFEGVPPMTRQQQMQAAADQEVRNLSRRSVSAKQTAEMRQKAQDEVRRYLRQFSMQAGA